MTNNVNENIEIAPPSVVKQAARDFAAALVETIEYKAFEQAADSFHRDQSAQSARQAYEQKQQSLRALIMLNALRNEQREELEQLKNSFFEQPVVQDFFTAQTDLAQVCQVLGDTLSEAIGLDYAAACGASCCG